jgi:hypothetical protein
LAQIGMGKRCFCGLKLLDGRETLRVAPAEVLNARRTSAVPAAVHEENGGYLKGLRALFARTVS